jgi:Carboxypeptidase regulatory-like domain
VTPMKRWALAAILAAGLVLPCLAPALFAQVPQASVAGTIFDERGAPVIAARLSLRGADTPLYLTKSTEQGAFLFARMEPGAYTLTIDQAGFCKLQIPSITVAAGERKSLPRITLKVPPDGQDCE